MLRQVIFILGLIATISAQNLVQSLAQNLDMTSSQNVAQNDAQQRFGQNSLPNESQKPYPPEQQPIDVNSTQQFRLQALMQISEGTEKFSLELYKVIPVQINVDRRN